ncbi:hypothetical protein D3C76_1177520 [compost metagenome]
MLPGPRGLDGGVERQQIGLLGHRLDDIEHTTNRRALHQQGPHGLGTTSHFHSQVVDLATRLAHQFIALTRLLVGMRHRFAGLTRVARDLLRRGGHLLHGGGGQFGFLALMFDTTAVAQGHFGQAAGHAVKRADTSVDAPDQSPQTAQHAAHGAQQLAQLITTTTV